MHISDLWVLGALVILVPTPSSGAPFHTNSIDIPISDARETESSVFVSPLNPDVVLVSNIRHINVTSIGVSAWISTDGGMNWVDQNSPLPRSIGDPASVISRVSQPNGRFFVNYLGSVEGQITSFKDSENPSIAWNDTTVFNSGNVTDKNHLWVDNNLNSAFPNRLYCGWSGPQLLAGTLQGILLSRSQDDGESWLLPPVEILHLDTRQGHLGVNIQTGPTGTVYAAWSNFRTTTPGAETIDFGFSSSADGGAFWTPPTILEDDVNGLGLISVRPPGETGITMIGNSFPSMTVDQNNGDIYLVWANRGVPTDGLLPFAFVGLETDIYIIKSSDGGGSWNALGSSPKRVNNPGVGDPFGTGGDGDQWHTWITWDDATGALAVVYLSSKDHPAQAETNVAVSHDGGGSWQELKISDELGSGDFGKGYDYIGISARDGIAYPVWSDDRQSVTPVRHRPYTSPILLWGPEETSIVANAVQDVQGSLDITVTWETNVNAPEADSLILSPPSGGPDFIISQSNPASGINHSLTLSVPCELGDWTFTVKSTRNGRTAKSTTRTFSTPSATITAEVQVFPQSSHYVVCPSGDGAPLVITVDFENHCNVTIASGAIELDSLPPFPPKTAFFPVQRTAADDSANVANNFMTTITKTQIGGGCSSTSVPVYANGSAVGTADFSAKSPDLTGDGFVDMSDLMSLPLGSCDPEPAYNVCADFVPNAGTACVDASDFATLAQHFGHNHLNPISKVGSGGRTSAASLDLDLSQLAAGRVFVTVRLSQIDGLTGMGLVLRPNSQKLQYVGWSQSATFDAVTAVASSSDNQGERVGIVGLTYEAISGTDVAVGTVEFSTQSTSVYSSDVVVSFEDLAEAGGTAVASQSRRNFGILDTRFVSSLGQNHPNPFNPTTTLEYTVRTPSHVRLSIFNVAGRLVRTLVNESRGRGKYSVVWDGRDDSGRHLSSGLYFSRLRTADVKEIRKLVLVR